MIELRFILTLLCCAGMLGSAFGSAFAGNILLCFVCFVFAAFLAFR